MLQTDRLAKQIWQRLRPYLGQKAIIFALVGPLGAGKTTFTKSLARAMGITDTILSPTFTLHSEYDQLDHIDLWRIEDPQELVALGLDKMVAAKRVIVVEWAEKAEKLIKGLSKKEVKLIWIKFEYGEKENERRISYEGFGNRDVMR